jgi:hypothetical protein
LYKKKKGAYTGKAAVGGDFGEAIMMRFVMKLDAPGEITMAPWLKKNTIICTNTMWWLARDLALAGKSPVGNS